MSDDLTSGPLEDLEQRWAEDRSPQLTLQLAEEFRRRGDATRAIEILRAGLEHHPSHVAARVALGRYLLDGGDAHGASEMLEKVADKDPTHLVATKLLVQAALALGDPKRAGNRLGLYETLNATDPDIEALWGRIDAAESGSGSEAREGGDVTVASDSADSDEPDEEPRAAIAGEGDEPFFGIWALPDRSAYRSALSGEGIFELVSATEPGDEVDVQGQAEGSVEGPSETAVPAEVLAEAVPEPGEATVTLGSLYLEQGHPAEAENIFRAVLESEPDNVEAQRGLSEAVSGGGALVAADLVAPEKLASAGRQDRKRLVLEGYRERLRLGAAESDHV